MSLSHLIHGHAICAPEVDAVRIRGSKMQYSEFDQRALHVAGVLKTLCGGRETIGIVGQRNFSAYIGILGVLYAGCWYTPINTKYSLERIERIIRDSSIRYLIGSLDAMEQLYPILESADLDVRVILPDDEVRCQSQLYIDRKTIDSFPSLDEPVSTEAGDLAYILYTSGSTGQPKGVQVTHGNVDAFLQNMNRMYSVSVGFRASQTFDLSFDLSVCDMFFTWSNLGTLCVLPEEELLLPSEYIRREEISFWYSVPTLASFIDRLGALTEGAFPNLKYSLFCGEPLPQILAEKWRRAAPGSTVENVYGPTEATIHLTRRIYVEGDKKRTFSNGMVPIGRPFPDHLIEIVDDFGLRVKPGDVGEIILAGPQITNGYLNDRTKTELVFVRYEWDPKGNTWYKSGDLGFYNADGELECLGRKDNQIKIAGRRVEIGEIESVLRKYPQLSDAVVVPLRNDDSTVRTLVAFTMNEVDEETEDFIRHDSIRCIESTFFPSKIITLESFPILASGKTDRKSLAEMAHPSWVPCQTEL